MARDDRGEPTLPTCVNGHRMLVGSTICPVCSAPVRRSTVARDRRSEDVGSEVRAKIDAQRAARGEYDTDRQPGRIVAATAAVLVLLGGGVAAMAIASGGGDAPAPTTPGITATTMSCDTLGVPQIALDEVIPSAPARACFSTDIEIVLSLGVEAADPESNLTLTLSKDTGGFIAGADSAFGARPEISTGLVPGIYVVDVALAGGGDPGNFTLYSTTFDPNVGPDPSATDGFSSGLPALSECGTSDVPLITDNGSVSHESDVALVCVTLTADSWTKVGAIGLSAPRAGEPGPDLILALHRYDDDGLPRFVRSFDDAFGTDPEASMRLSAGTYLIEVEEFAAGTTGPIEIYVDTDRTYFRVGPVTEGFGDVSAADCAAEGVRQITVGGTLGFENSPISYTCLSLNRTALLDIDVLTLAEQDLAVEVIGFDSTGSPLRYGWADDYAFVQDFFDKDPRLETVLPEGLYLIRVTEIFAAPVGSFTISVSALNADDAPLRQ